MYRSSHGADFGISEIAGLDAGLRQALLRVQVEGVSSTWTPKVCKTQSNKP